MDPNANLKELLALAQGIQDEEEQNFATEYDDETLHLVELVLALDKWLANGGFLPDRWKRTEDSAS